MTDTSGFYAMLDGELYHAPNFVSGPGFDLNRDNMEHRATGAGPWEWHESREDAEAWLTFPEDEE